MIRRSSGAVLALGCLLAGLAACAGDPGVRPNLVLITVDTTRADHLSVYGYAEPTTPVLESLASEAVLFERAFSHVPITLPAHTSIMTGTFPTYHGVRDNGRFTVRDDLETLAERLSAEGYTTAAFVSAFVLDSRYGLDQGFEVYDDDYGAQWSEEDIRDVRIYNTMVVDRRGNQTTDRALQWLAEKGEEPFFLWIHYYDPHQRYDPPSPYREQFGELYDGEIAFMDAQIGLVFDALRERGVWERTAVLVAGDHGEGLGDHEEATHAILPYDSTLRIPLIVKPPEGAGVDSGSVETPVSQVDLHPTMLQLLGLEPGSVGHGRSLLPLMRSGVGEDHAAYFECNLPLFSYGWEPLFGLRVGEWKYIRAPQPELYDLDKDPQELYNLAAVEPERLAELEEQLFRIVDQTSTDPVEAKTLDAETQARLEALGYVSGGAVTSDLNPREPTGRMSPMEGLVTLGDYFIANHLASRGRLAEAAVTFETILLPLDPANATYVSRLAELKRRLGDLDGSFELLRRAQELNPEDAQLLQLLAQLEADRGNQDEAIELLRAAEQLAPQDLHGKYLLALMTGRAEDHSSAVDLYREVLELDSSHRDSRINLGVVLAQSGELAEARQQLEEARRLAPWHGRTHYNLGLVARAEGEMEAARSSFERALELRDRYPDARLALAVTLIELGDEAGGRAELERIEAEAPDSRAGEQARLALDALG